LPSDVKQFVDKGISKLRYFKTKPVLKGLSFTPNLELGSPVIEGNSWKYYAGSGTAVCLMGEIAYPIDYYKMGDIQNWERKLLASNLHIETNIGEVQVTASREALQMSPKTIAAIRARLQTIKQEMIVETEKQFKAAKTIVEAKSMYYSTLMSGTGYGDILRKSEVTLTWNGHKIQDNIVSLDSNGLPHTVLTYTIKGWRKKVINLVSETRLVCTPGMELYYDDTDKKIVRYKRRAVTLINGGAKKVTVVKTYDPAGFEKLTGIPVSSLKSFQAVQETHASIGRVSTGVDKAKREKHQTRAFVLDTDRLMNPIVLTAKSDYWSVKNVVLSKGLYVPIFKFQPTLHNIKLMSDLRDALKYLEKFGVKLRLPVYGIKEGEDTGKLVRFDTWLTKKVGRIKNIQYDASLVKSFQKHIKNGLGDVSLTGLAETPKAYITLYKQAESLYNNGSSERARLLQLAGVLVEKNAKFEQLRTKFYTDYGMLGYIWYSSQYTEPEVLTYLKEKR